MSAHYQDLMNEFTPTLAKLKSSKNEIIIAGDYNVNFLDVNNINIISEYFDMYATPSFYLKIAVPIRLSNKHGTLINN